jgi:LCP family protein required for cell wall assembly
MDKDKVDSAFDFDGDPEFNANFYKNIEKVLGDCEPATDDAIEITGISADDKAEQPAEILTDNAEASDSGEDNLSPAETSTEENAAALEAAEEAQENEIDDELVDINASLAKQISAELDTAGTEQDIQKKHRLLRLQSGIALALLCLAGFGFFFGFTKPGNNLLLDMGINLGGTLWASMTKEYENTPVATEDIDYVDEEDDNPEAVEIDTTTIIWPNNDGEGKKEEGVYNILLLGEEAIGQGAGRGRTDEIIIATLNTNQNAIKLTSLMRDILVQIPGFKDNKLNVAYEEGGIDLLYRTIELNFDIHLDGSVLVNFENFEKIVDELGGLEITLTAEEARYLQRTNYISDPDNRDVVEGKQLMNGNQVLGYSRVRKRAAITGNNNDYGRTDRHRMVLDAIFGKCKSMDVTQLASLMFKFIPMITTDISSKNFQALLDAYLKTGATEIQQLRIPADGAFEDNVKVRGMSVLIPDFEENIDILHSFIFGDDTVNSEGSTAGKN